MSTHARMEQEIAQVVADSSPSHRRPLYGYTSEANAYLVDDYPYGFRERTQIRYWLEEKPKKGWRFVSQTMNPKTRRWNKPKATTYVDWGAAMYLDEKGHVAWSGVGAYSDESKILAFVREFPGADLHELRAIVPQKIRFTRGLLSGEMFFTVNGVRQSVSESDRERLHRELAIWEEIAHRLASAR